MSVCEPVSIYIVTYMNDEDRGGILRTTCESALAQRYPAFEVVVSDNGGSYAAADALSSIDDPRLKVIRHEENVGFTGNINRCLDLCRYDLIKPLCDDDLIHPDFIRLAVPFVDDRTMVMGDVEKFRIGTRPAGLEVSLSESPEVDRWDCGYAHGVWSIRYSSSCIPSAVLFTRKLFAGLGGYDSKTITSDWDFFIEACLHARTLCLKHVLCYVGVWEGSLTEQMLAKPFFYPHESLYTKFRVFHCKGLPGAAQTRLLLRLFKELFWQGLRPFRHPFRICYWQGYGRYLIRFFRLLFAPKSRFGSRPNNP